MEFLCIQLLSTEQEEVNDPGATINSRFNFHYVIHEHPEHYTIMRKWILTWILPTLLYRSCFHIICLVGTISLACNDMTPEQMATNVNCSSPERHTRSYDYMEGGDIRVRRLFCRTQWYLRIDKRGKVKGTQEMKNSYNIMEIRTVAVGIVAIKGVESEYYLAMNKEGKLYAKKECNEDCNFKELILENHYNTYASAKWTHSGGEMFVALNQKGIPVRGKKTKKEQKTAHFLPMAIT
ncbi:Fibroblast growth factor 7 [Vulpes lagopus]|uniref:fibroblast growth factor 7 isoform X1 n=2 Tax=Vulpes lagopus TaxID=494514 RepID=UPI001BC989F4|nr:fibroblast growth factor 7 isoform X1 [Vulpes lagopus]